MPSVETIRIQPGKPLGFEPLRQRPTGRIDGLPNGCPVAVDADFCYLDGTLLRTIADWQRVIQTNQLHRVVGAFVIAWRDDNGHIHLARDLVGERTLFYHVNAQGIFFASTLRALLATSQVARNINLRAVARYLCCAYLPGEETLIDNVLELLPGEHLTWSPSGVVKRNYIELPTTPPDTTTPEEIQARNLRATLEETIQRLLPVSDEPIAATLSGGIDSSLVVALLKKLHSGPLHTFSVSFGDAYANELPHSNMVAEHCKTIHRIVEISPAAVLHYLDESVGVLGDPIGDPLTVPNSLLFREASRQSGIVFNGEGGDPCFGGPKNQPMVLSELYPGPLSRSAHYLRAHLKCYDDLNEMLTDPVRDAIAGNVLERELELLLHDPRRDSLIDRLQATNIRLKGGHHILPKVDALSAPLGILPRSPLFDRKVVEFSLTIPPQYKLHGNIEKYLLKRAVTDLLPDAIVNRPKSGMLVPVEGWFRGPLLPAAKERLLDGLTKYNLIRRDYFERLIAGKLGGLRPRHGAKTWLLITLESWLRSVVG